MDVIEEIYINSIQPSEHRMHRDREYRRTKNQINQYYQNLCKKLSKKDLLTLDKLISCYDIKRERIYIALSTALKPDFQLRLNP